MGNGREGADVCLKLRSRSAARCSGRIRLQGLVSPGDLSADTRRGGSPQTSAFSLGVTKGGELEPPEIKDKME